MEAIQQDCPAADTVRRYQNPAGRAARVQIPYYGEQRKDKRIYPAPVQQRIRPRIVAHGCSAGRGSGIGRGKGRLKGFLEFSDGLPFVLFTDKSYNAPTLTGVAIRRLQPAGAVVNIIAEAWQQHLPLKAQTGKT